MVVTQHRLTTAVCVRAQDNNSPRTNHGLEVMYQFCGDADGMQRSRRAWARAEREREREGQLMGQPCA